jgi:orotate phosphoribosyltransferase
LGRAYAAEIVRQGIACDLVFGPAYKGIPLAVATASALAQLGRDTPFGFDRKERKDHGEGGVFVGTAPADGMKVVLVDDVITSGMSIRESIELLQGAADVTISGIIVAVDRQERGLGSKTTLAELRDSLGVKVFPILTIRALADWLHGREIQGQCAVGDQEFAAISLHLAEFGGSE